jgi:hypothetical protein
MGKDFQHQKNQVLRGVAATSVGDIVGCYINAPATITLPRTSSIKSNGLDRSHDILMKQCQR